MGFFSLTATAIAYKHHRRQSFKRKRKHVYDRLNRSTAIGSLKSQDTLKENFGYATSRVRGTGQMLISAIPIIHWPVISKPSRVIKSTQDSEVLESTKDIPSLKQHIASNIFSFSKAKDQ